MTDAQKWEDETPVSEYGIEVPSWVERRDISPNDIAAIVQGGCASGAYMPAVTYYDARNTMTRHGDDILQFLQDTTGELPKPRDEKSWSGMACFYLSCAVELWASEVDSALDDTDPADFKD